MFAFCRLGVAVLLLGTSIAAAAERPNIIFILADDLAPGDLGSNGQKLIKTPQLDRMAAEGTRFTQVYTGTSVCAPSRASLMTGMHMGHCPIRANREIQPEGQKPLPEGTVTVARLLHDAGYATACIGKWGLGMFDTSGSPLKMGFDHFFGYNCQRHAHSYFPAFLYNDDKRFDLPGNSLPHNDGKGIGKTYAQNLIAEDALGWVRRQKDRPFFLYFALTLPHAKYEIDDLGQYASTDWTPQQKAYAAMVTRLDSDVGRLLVLLKELNLDKKTVVLFSAGDNGSAFAPNSDLVRRFDSSMGLRGEKRTMYEGGLRQTVLARWPDKIPAGRVCNEPWAFWDFLPTALELAGEKKADSLKIDGHSVAATLLGGPAPKRDCFYWELHEGWPIQAVRFGDWKAVRNGLNADVELYDLKTDPGESTDLAEKNPDLVQKAVDLMKHARTDDPDWPLQPAPKPKAKAKAKR